MVNNIQGVLKYAFLNPTRDGKSWRGWCASFVQRALNVGAIGDAINMYRWARDAGRIRTDGPPPVGALVYWGTGSSVNSYHVAISLGSWVVVGTSAPNSPFPWDANMNTLGVFRIQDYKSLPYLGWTTWAKGVGELPNGAASGPEFWREWQGGILRQFGYSDIVDNWPGTNTYKALQRATKTKGYTGPEDGKPGANTLRYWVAFLGW